ncbi:MAG: site-2 protease family protein [Acidobacteria bacterium]|nr:site-2 protease family protein [Acidobacteriota bacterium]
MPDNPNTGSSDLPYRLDSRALNPGDQTVVDPAWYFAPRYRPRYWLHVLLLLLTFFTTLVVGSRLQFNFLQGLAPFTSDNDFFPITWALSHPKRLLMGIPFSFSLMLILLAHEMGHYVYCVRYGVVATLPFFIPAPTPIGTMGAFIRIRSPMRSRRALFDIGIAGPIAGFAVALVISAISLELSRPALNGSERFLPHDLPLVFHGIHFLLLRGTAGYVPLEGMLLHPVAVAAWVGMFATALNLLPGGQLDGGHMLYALSPRLHRWVTRATILGLVITGCFLWSGWLVWAVVLVITMRHPPIAGYGNYRTLLGYGTESAGGTFGESWRGLGRARIFLAAGALAMLIVTFMPMPIEDAGLLRDLIPQRNHSQQRLGDTEEPYSRLPPSFRASAVSSVLPYNFPPCTKEP